MNLLSKMKANMTLNAILTILVGILFIANPGGSGKLIVTAAGAIILCAGIIDIIRFIGAKNRDMSTSGILLTGIVKLILGILILTHTGGMLTLLIYLFGLYVLFGGFQSMGGAFRLKKVGVSGWAAHFVLSLIIIIAAIFMLAYPFGVVETAIMISGIILMVDGITELLTGVRMKKL